MCEFLSHLFGLHKTSSCAHVFTCDNNTMQDSSKDRAHNDKKNRVCCAYRKCYKAWWQGTPSNDTNVTALQVPYTLTVVSPSSVNYESADNLVVASSGNGIGNLTATMADLAIPAGENLKANVSFTVNATNQV